jgi:L-2-hydroxyglutarate oxidase LhgO
MLRIGIVGGGVVGATIAYELSAINKDLNILKELHNYHWS